MTSKPETMTAALMLDAAQRRDPYVAVLDDRARLRAGWLRSIQAENSCAATGQPCRERCACVLEQAELMEADNAR